MKFKLKARAIKDTRGDKTIEVELKTGSGKFKASAPNGKSRGKFESKPYKKGLLGDIKVINGIVGEIKFEKFDDLAGVEKIFRKKVGANTMIAIEYCFLKALARSQKKQVWEIINGRARKIPMPVGNAIGGGTHSQTKSKPDFQEFLFIPKVKSFKKAVKINKIARYECMKVLKLINPQFKKKTNDENAWMTLLGEEQILAVMLEVKDKIEKKYKLKMQVGLDCAASQIYKKSKYRYKGPVRIFNKKQQINYIYELSKKVYYIEDGLDERDFEGFKKLGGRAKSLIVGDDLTVTNLSRIKKAGRGIKGVIIKPNQNGSLIEVSEIVKFCRGRGIKMIFSHRSGETKEDILSDLCFGFGGDFIKTGVVGKGRDEKLNRLVRIEKSL